MTVVIVGGGTAGLAAAVTAGEVGLEATLVEKTDRLGGMLAWSSGHFSGAGTRRQAARGIDDDPDLHYREVMAWLRIADDIRSLAGRMELPAGALEQELADYSSESEDRFGRTHRPAPISRPPFYAVRSVGGMLLSRAGPVVDDELRPLDATGTPIRGLYAVGELLGMGRFSGTRSPEA